MWSRLRPEDQNFGLGLDHGLENMVSVLSSVSKSCCHLTSMETAEFIRGCLGDERLRDVKVSILHRSRDQKFGISLGLSLVGLISVSVSTANVSARSR